MASKSTKRNYFSRKNIPIVILIFPLATVILIIGIKILSTKLYDYKIYRLNHLSKDDLSNIYTNAEIGYSFNYPKNTNVYKWFGTEENS